METHSSVLAWRIPGMGGAWWAAVYGVAQSRTRLKRLSSSSSSMTHTTYFLMYQLILCKTMYLRTFWLLFSACYLPEFCQNSFLTFQLYCSKLRTWSDLQKQAPGPIPCPPWWLSEELPLGVRSSHPRAEISSWPGKSDQLFPPRSGPRRTRETC